MSKIPVAQKGFRSWLSTNEGKPSKGVLYEQKYQNHHDRIRNKENMSENEGQSSSTFPSMVNPQPTAKDYEEYDKDRRIKEKARNMRVAQRSASSSARTSLSLTPEPKETSPTNDQYFTPKRGSGDGLDEEFVTPSTSKKEKRRDGRSSGSQNLTPVSSKPPRHRSTEEHAYYTTCLSRKMEENFTRMQDFVFSGHSVKEARERALLETTTVVSATQSSPRTSRRSVEETTVIVNRSSSQPPPIETLNSFQRVSRAESPGPTRVKEFPVIRTSYVDTLVATHQRHMQYADRVVVSVEKQMTKLESMKNLAALSPAAKEAKRRRTAAEALRKLMETEEQTEKKRSVVRDLKDRISKISEVQLATHKLVSSRPFRADPYNERLLQSLDGWVALPFDEFDVQTARELQALHKKMLVTLDKFKNVAALHRKNHNRSFNSSRRSIAMRILPSEFSTAESTSDPPRHLANDDQTREAATQVTARLADVAMTQTSPRRLGVEPLDLSSLEKRHSASQTTPPRVASTVLTEDAAQQTTPKETQPSNSFPNPSNAVTLSMTQPTIVDIDEMLNNIQLHNESLETIEPFSHFKSDISYPLVSAEQSAESTPRSARVSLDSESARRLSAGVSHFLEKVKKENESFEKSDAPETGFKQEQPMNDPPMIEVDSPSTAENSAVSSENQSPPLNEESEAELNINEHDATQFEHEMEEQEEQRMLRESAVTPTPPRKLEQDSVVEGYQQMSYIDPEDDEDETKKFVNSDEFERSLEDEGFDPQDIEGPDDSADDSGFLLDNRPAPHLKSIFDNQVRSPNSNLRADTPRVSDQANETTFGNLDMEEYCQNDFLKEIGPVMVRKAIEFQNELRGLDWISAQAVWKPPSFEEIHMDFYDHFDFFDSYSILIWGAVVDLINVNYLKFGRKLTDLEERNFEKEALDLLQTEYGPESKKREWSKEVKMSKKLAGMMPYDLDYRYDVRRGIPDSDKQKYQWQQVQMSVIADRYPRKQLRDELDKVYNSEKENLGQIIIDTELEQVLNGTEEESKPQDSAEKIAGVSDV